MNAIKLLVVLSLVGSGYQYWSKYDVRREVAAESANSSNGFVALPALVGVNPTTVVVLAAENCSGEAAQRADSLAEELTRNGIPVTRSHNFRFNT